MNLLIPFVSISALLAAASSLVVQNDPQPMAPINPILVITEVGSVATINDKVEVTFAAQMIKNETKNLVHISDEEMFGGKHSLEVEALDELASALDAASDEVLAGEPYNHRTRAGVVRVVKGETVTVIDVKFERDQTSILGSNSIQLDADNAVSLARILRRAERVSVWMMPCLEHFKPDKR